MISEPPLVTGTNVGDDAAGGLAKVPTVVSRTVPEHDLAVIADIQRVLCVGAAFVVDAIQHNIVRDGDLNARKSRH
jgi:hypothetical protein